MARYRIIKVLENLYHVERKGLFGWYLLTDFNGDPRGQHEVLCFSSAQAAKQYVIGPSLGQVVEEFTV